MNFNTLEQSQKNLEQFQKNPFFGIGVDFDPVRKLIEESQRQERLEELRDDIGEELFSQLSEEDRQFIIETEGIVDLGYEASEQDLNRIFKYIENNGG